MSILTCDHLHFNDHVTYNVILKEIIWLVVLQRKLNLIGSFLNGSKFNVKYMETFGG